VVAQRSNLVAMHAAVQFDEIASTAQSTTPPLFRKDMVVKLLKIAGIPPVGCVLTAN
jgi:hypothetical protein